MTKDEQIAQLKKELSEVYPHSKCIDLEKKLKEAEATITELFQKNSTARELELESKLARCEGALKKIVDWEFDFRSDCVADCRFLAREALSHLSEDDK